jgi:hypothetical protein
MQLTIQIISYCRLNARADRIFRGALETYEGALITVRGLSAQGHAYLDDLRKRKEGPLAKALKAVKANAPEWVARYLITSGVGWALGIAGLFAASQIPEARRFLLSVWLGQHQRL